MAAATPDPGIVATPSVPKLSSSEPLGSSRSTATDCDVLLAVEHQDLAVALHGHAHSGIGGAALRQRQLSASPERVIEGPVGLELGHGQLRARDRSPPN